MADLAFFRACHPLVCVGLGRRKFRTYYTSLGGMMRDTTDLLLLPCALVLNNVDVRCAVFSALGVHGVG